MIGEWHKMFFLRFQPLFHPHCTSTINEDLVQINISNSGPNFKILTQKLYLSSYFLFGIPFLKSPLNVQFRFSDNKSTI